jgi:hypothetical protein
VLKCVLQDYVKAVRSFKLKDAFPNMESHPYDWRVDKYEPQRVWFTVRNTATHTGPLHFAGATYKATGKVRRRVRTSAWQSSALHPSAPPWQFLHQGSSVGYCPGTAMTTALPQPGP